MRAGVPARVEMSVWDSNDGTRVFSPRDLRRVQETLRPYGLVLLRYGGGGAWVRREGEFEGPFRVRKGQDAEKVYRFNMDAFDLFMQALKSVPKTG